MSAARPPEGARSAAGGEGIPVRPEVSVVMPTYHRPVLLERCLRALLAQTLAPERFEVLVVDDGHDDLTREQVQAIAAAQPLPRIRYLRANSGRGPAVARNFGWRQASAPLIAFTDDDTIPASTWLKAAMRSGWPPEA